MQLIKDLLIDSMNGFSPRFIPFFLLQLLCAGLFAYILQKIFVRKFNIPKIQGYLLIAVIVAIVTTLSKNSLPMAVIGAATLLLFLKDKELKGVELIAFIATIAVGFGCGSGSIVQTLIGTCILGLIIVFLPLRE